jgi:very-short-patch-repair endonuclease
VGMPTFRPRATTTARELRNSATPAERELWRHLSRSQLDGCKFSRQIPIGPYFGDFVCRSHGLVVEIDGESHDTRIGYDASRTEQLTAAGYKVIRFTNSDVFERVEGVLIKIREALHDRPTPTPSREREGNLVE